MLSLRVMAYTSRRHEYQVENQGALVTPSRLESRLCFGIYFDTQLRKMQVTMRTEAMRNSLGGADRGEARGEHLYFSCDFTNKTHDNPNIRVIVLIDPAGKVLCQCAGADLSVGMS